MKTKSIKRLVSLVLSVTMILGLFPAGLANAAAGDRGSISNVNAAVGSKVADPHSLHGWEAYFGEQHLNTENAGGVWTDKSVFTSAEAFKAAMEEGEVVTPNDNYDAMSVDSDNFLVALSAIAATEEIVGYAALPTDSVFILDVSQSMDKSNYVPTMVEAANSAIQNLMDLNRHNRVSVILYSGNADASQKATLDNATVLLPLDRYTPGPDGKYITYIRSYSFLDGFDTTVSVASGVKNSDKDPENQSVTGEKNTAGGTYIQSGLYRAYEQFKGAYEDGTTVIDSDLIQGGTGRIPVIALMSDGLPTVATTGYNTLSGDSNVGTGEKNNDTITFLTQLTAKWLKDSASDFYGTEALFYSLWLKGANDNSSNPTLDPSASGNTLDRWWRSYLNAADGAEVSFRINEDDTFQVTRDSVVDQVPAVDPATEEYTAAWQKAQAYVNKAFAASNAEGFKKAFEDIVEVIIAQSRYYPTMVTGQDNENSGYITIEDPLGAFMEVKEVEGIDIGGHLFTGEALVKMMINDQFGSRDTYTENGWRLVNTIRTRVGVSESVAIALAQDAWRYGQLGYDQATGKYSNYIGYYSDDDNNYLGFWHEGHTAADVPANATRIVKSYGFYGVVDETISDSNIEGTDMMYVSVRVSTQIADGDQTVSLRIPAALIPLVVYEAEVNATSVAAATEASLKVSGATHPLRLLMEVGLRDEINELTVANAVQHGDHFHTDDEGNFVFYTNRWGQDTFDGGMQIGEPSFTDHTAAVSHFNPSVMNQMYYYNQDSAIYTNTSGTRYTGAEKPEGEGYYHLSYVFTATSNGGAAEIRKEYVPITSYAIDFAEKDADSDGWYVPRGTARHDIIGYTVGKDPNATGTLAYVAKADRPGYGEGKYEVYMMHGNNGRIVLTQTTGMELTKEIPVVIPGTSTEDFVLHVAFTAPAGETLPETVKVSYDAMTYEEVDVDDVQVTLDANQKVWIYGLPGGTAYTVTEEVHDDYAPSLAQVSGTLTEKQITPVTFTNRAKERGRVVITKKVEHPFTGETVPSTIDFDFIATVTDKNGTIMANTVLATSAGNMTTSAEGTVAFSLTDGASLAINGTVVGDTVQGLESGTTVTVREVNLAAGSGFTADKEFDSAVVENEVVKEIVFTNTYSPASADGSDVKIRGTKVLEGREWQEFDSYRFRLQYWNGVRWETLAGGADDTATKQDPTFTLSDVIANFAFDHEGSYRFWIVEEEGELGGITYDSSVREFYVNVEDNWNGEYEIASVTADSSFVNVSSATLNGATEYTVQTSFTNVYGTGTTYIDLKGAKELIGDDLSKYTGADGFAFDLYTATADSEGNLTKNLLVYTAHPDDEGKILFDHNYIGHLVFDEAGTYYFIAEEAEVGNDPLMVFDDSRYEIRVVVRDNLRGGLVPEVTVVKVTGSTRISVNADQINFTNERKPDPIRVPLPGKKNYNRTLTDGMFTFDLYEATLSGTSYTAQGNALLSASNDAAGSFTFQDGAGTNVLTFTEAGDRYYVVKERLPAGVTAANPTKNGITYDTTSYGVTVRVSQVLNGEGRSVLTYQILVNGDGSIVFDNSYDASAATGVTVSGEKTLNGSVEGTDNFTFELYKATVNGSTVTLGDKLDSKNPTNGAFRFDELRYTSLTDVGDHYYVVKEKIPAGADSTNTLNGITYDSRQYLVKVAVTDNGDGTLNVVQTVTLNGAASEIKFENRYSITAVANVAVSGKKTAQHFTLKDGDFTFDLYKATVNGSTVTLGDKIDTKSNVGGVFTFDAISYNSLADVGDHYYVVKESLPIAAGQSNVYQGVTYDRDEYLVKITVTDNGDGTLKTVTTSTLNGVASDILFENVYGITTANGITVRGEKVLSDKTLADGIYYFELYSAAVDAQGKVSTVGTAIDSETNVSGKFSFDTIVYNSLDDVGTHYYAVKEKIPAGADENHVYQGVTYDTATYLVTVTVTDNGDGTLGVSAVTTKDGQSAADILFTNKYGAMTPATVVLGGEKTLDGKAPKDGAFEFALYTVTEGQGGSIILSENPVETVSTKDGKFSFKELRFTKLADVGTYYFAIKEVIPAGADEKYVKDGIAYDPTVYYAQVVVEDCGDGNFKVTAAYANDEGPVEKVVFANQTVPTVTPPTFDRTNLGLWMALFFVSGASLFVIPLAAKKKRKNA